MGKPANWFDQKRPWSTIKDRVLKNYLPPYLAKVAHLGKPILLVDAFAGAGIFGDGTFGSPLFMCQEAERFASGRYEAIFVNKEQRYHDQLVTNLASCGWDKPFITPVLGDARDLLRSLPATLGDETLFLYMDPFGLRGCELKLLQPFLTRGSHVSTEILFLIHMPIIHRLAMSRQVQENRTNARVADAFHSQLTTIFGGTYWQDILWDGSLPVEEQQHRLMVGYQRVLKTHMPYVHFCPVQQSQDTRVKYYLVFASRHQDAMLLMNDIMAKAYHEHMHHERNKGTLWEAAEWRGMRSVNEFADDIEGAILSTAVRRSNWSRDALWAAIVEDHFMQYTPTDYLAALKQLASRCKLVYEKDPRTGRHNGSSRVALLATS